MIDSQGRTSADLLSFDVAPSNGDQYDFVDETFLVAEKNINSTPLLKRGIKRTFEDLIKNDSHHEFDCNTKIPSENSATKEEQLLGQTSVNLTTDNCSINSVVNKSFNGVGTTQQLSISCSTESQTSGWTSATDSNNNSSNDDSCSRVSNASTETDLSGMIGGGGRGRGCHRRGKSYGLRPRANLRKSADDKESPERPNRKGGRRGRARGNTLSKYRRNTANARERDRMREINTAFATLRGVLPSFACRRIASMTKITTLKLATSYIRALADILKDPPPPSEPNVQYFASHLPSPSTSASVAPHLGSGVPRYESGTVNLHCGEPHGRPTTEVPTTYFDERVDSLVEGKVEGRWWSTVESDVLQGLDSEIAWDDLTLPDMCWGMS
ncbi:Myc-type basic helix-loop-helix (bHLH) domain [Trinorchestia longiramus]|nr:Myc-type basic helix-loop-helix (bHLH) domain [Trinorchestia longiramus]